MKTMQWLSEGIGSVVLCSAIWFFTPQEPILPQNESSVVPAQSLTSARVTGIPPVNSSGRVPQFVYDFTYTPEVPEKPDRSDLAGWEAQRDVFEAVLQPRQEFEIDPTVENTLLTQEGTRILIPADAIVQKDGEPVMDKVKITYRQFDSGKELALSNLPMALDAQNGIYMQSAGMFELLAFAESKEPLFLAPGTEMGMEMPALDPENSYNLYILNEDDSWTETASDLRLEKASPQQPDSAWTFFTRWMEGDYVLQDSGFHAVETVVWRETATDKNTGEKVRKVYLQFKPTHQVSDRYHILRRKICLGEMSNSEYYALKRGFRRDELTELDTWFEKEKKAKEKRHYKRIFRNAGTYWLNAEIDFTGPREIGITLTQSDTTLYLKGESASRISVLERVLVNRKKRNERALDGKIAAYVQWKTRSEERQFLDSAYVAVTDQRYVSDVENRLYRKFALNGFGIWNCDRPAKIPTGAQFALAPENFPLGLMPYMLKLTDMKSNMVISMYNSMYNKLTYNPKHTTLFYYVMHDGKIAFLNPSALEDWVEKRVNNPAWVICTAAEFEQALDKPDVEIPKKMPA